MERHINKLDRASTSGEIIHPARGPRWKYRDISMELTAHLMRGRTRYAIPTYIGEGWGHAYLKIVVAAHLLHWGYEWTDVLWEYSPSDSTARKRADIFARGRNGLPSFWFECGTADNDKLRELRSALSSDVRLVNVMLWDWFRRWWNGDLLRLQPSLDSKGKRTAVWKQRANFSVVGVEYWAVYDTSTSARILFAVRPDGNDRYTYFDTGEGWSLSNISMLSRSTDSWASLIPGVAGGNRESGFGTYLPRRKEADSSSPKTVKRGA